MTVDVNEVIVRSARRCKPIIENDPMTHSTSQCKNDFEFEVTSQTDSIRDSSINDALIAIAQEVAELLKQSYPLQTDEIDAAELITGDDSAK